MMRQEVRPADPHAELLRMLVNGAEVTMVICRQPFTRHEIRILDRDRRWKSPLQHGHICEDGLTINFRCEILGIEPAGFAKFNSRFRKVDSFDFAVKFTAKGCE